MTSVRVMLQLCTLHLAIHLRIVLQLIWPSSLVLCSRTWANGILASIATLYLRWKVYGSHACASANCYLNRFRRLSNRQTQTEILCDDSLSHNLSAWSFYLRQIERRSMSTGPCPINLNKFSKQMCQNWCRAHFAKVHSSRSIIHGFRLI